MMQELHHFGQLISGVIFFEIFFAFWLLLAQHGITSKFGKRSIPEETRDAQRQERRGKKPSPLYALLAAPTELDRWKVSLIMDGAMGKNPPQLETLKAHFSLHDIELLRSMYAVRIGKLFVPKEQKVLFKTPERTPKPIEQISEAQHALPKEHLNGKKLFWDRVLSGELLVWDYALESETVESRYLLIDVSNSLDCHYLASNKAHAKAMALEIMRRWIAKAALPFYIRFFESAASKLMAIHTRQEALDAALTIYQWQQPKECLGGTDILSAVEIAVQDIETLPGIPKNVVLITDGESEKPLEEHEFRGALRRNGLFAVIVGDNPDPAIERVAAAYMRMPRKTFIQEGGEMHEELNQLLATAARMVQ